MSDLHKSDPDTPYADDLEFVRDYARRNDGYALVQPVVDFINAHPDPQIIRSVEEQEALDPDTLLMSRKGYIADAEDNIRIPAAVIATGDQVRAAFKALREA